MGKIFQGGEALKDDGRLVVVKRTQLNILVCPLFPLIISHPSSSSHCFYVATEAKTTILYILV